MTSQFRPAPLPKVIIPRPKELQSVFADETSDWLVTRAACFSSSGRQVFVLIHLDDGVLWGRIEQGKLITPEPGPGAPKLRMRAIQQCRVFGPEGELFIWRESEGVWRGREVIEEEGVAYGALSETQILWGNRVDTDRDRSADLSQGFTPLIESTTGIRQIVPIAVAPTDLHDSRRRVTLSVFHYLTEDNDGQSRIWCSRLSSVELRQV